MRLHNAALIALVIAPMLATAHDNLGKSEDRIAQAFGARDLTTAPAKLVIVTDVLCNQLFTNHRVSELLLGHRTGGDCVLHDSLELCA